MWNAECGMRNGSATVDSAFRTPHSALASMLNVALTGNIAAGKSTVVELFHRWGATIIDADALAREAQAPGGDVLAAIAGRFGADVLASDGTLDRAALRGKVMGDQAALDALNQIVHPAVRRRREELLREAREGGDLLVVNDIPLLFEALDPAQFDAVVLVDAGVALRRTRLRAMRGLSNDEADRMIAAQMPAERKRATSARGVRRAARPRGGGGLGRATRARAAARRGGGARTADTQPDRRPLRGRGTRGPPRDGRRGRDRAGAGPARDARRHRRDRGGRSRGRAGVGGRGPSGRADVPLGGPRPRRGAARSPALGRRAGAPGRARCGRPGAPVRY